MAAMAGGGGLLSSSGMRSEQTQLLVGDSGELSGGETYHNKKAANTTVQ